MGPIISGMLAVMAILVLGAFLFDALRGGPPKD